MRPMEGSAVRTVCANVLIQMCWSGVPPNNLQGVIFVKAPSDDQVILNLVEVYADSEFTEACETHREAIPGFSWGIGKYGDSQFEIVLDIEALGTDEVLSYGGFSSTVEDLAALALGHAPSSDELELFELTMAKAGIRPGPWWLSADGTRRVLNRLAPRLAELRANKK